MLRQLTSLSNGAKLIPPAYCCVVAQLTSHTHSPIGESVCPICCLENYLFFSCSKLSNAVILVPFYYIFYIPNWKIDIACDRYVA